MKLIDKPSEDNSKFKGAKFVVNELESNGHAAFIVGGAVRDLYMGVEPSEFDISTSATPKEIENIFKKTKPVGQSFGVMLVIIDNLFFEVATFREDMNYIDGRHPEDVKYTKDPEIDIKRRDFTVNGLMLNPNTFEIVDFCRGCEDIDSKILRTIGNPAERFSEDHLRILRAIRFSNKYDLKLSLIHISEPTRPY